MSGRTDRRKDAGEQLITRPVPQAPSPDRLGPRLAWLSVAGIVGSVLIMIAASAIRNSWERPRIHIPAAGPPGALSVHVSPTAGRAGMWGAALLAGAGGAAGLVARTPAAPPPLPRPRGVEGGA